MLYLVCRADQVPNAVNKGGQASVLRRSDYYPRFVSADSAQDAIDRAFHPEQYKPGGARDLVVIELGEVYEFTAVPIPPTPPPPTYTLQYTGRNSNKLRTREC